MLTGYCLMTNGLWSAFVFFNFPPISMYYLSDTLGGGGGVCGVGGEELKKIKYKDKRKFPCSHHPAVVTIYISVSYKSFFNVYIFLIKKGIVVLFHVLPFPC